jgi:hypothetical protein
MLKARPRKVESKGGFLIIDGDYYTIDTPNEDGNFDTGEMKWKKVDKEKIEKIVDEIAEKLKDALDPKVVIRDALFDLSTKDLKKLTVKLIKEKAKPRITVKKHCVQMKVGGVKIYIR